MRSTRNLKEVNSLLLTAGVSDPPPGSNRGNVAWAPSSPRHVRALGRSVGCETRDGAVDAATWASSKCQTAPLSRASRLAGDCSPHPLRSTVRRSPRATVGAAMGDGWRPTPTCRSVANVADVKPAFGAGVRRLAAYEWPAGESSPSAEYVRYTCSRLPRIRPVVGAGQRRPRRRTRRCPYPMVTLGAAGSRP
jgi:hypothetical protein